MSKKKKTRIDSKESIIVSPAKESTANVAKNETANTTTNAVTETDKEDPTPKAFSTAEIFAAMNSKALRFQELCKNIAENEAQIKQIKTRMQELSAKIKPISRLAKKFNPRGENFAKITPQQRKTIKHEIKMLKNQKILIEDQNSGANAELVQIDKNMRGDLKLDELRNKAQSKHWTKRNKRFVEARILKTLNTSIKDYKEDLVTLYNISITDINHVNEEFEKALSKFLDNVDIETAILCSHELRKESYEIIRLTITEWDIETTPEFTKLVFPEKK